MTPRAEDYLPFVAKIAHAALQRLPFQVRRQVQLDDLRSAGYIGLLEAIKSFDAERGVPFEAFAYRRVFGAIVDDLRSFLPLSRDHWNEVKAGSAVVIERSLTDFLIERLPQPAADMSFEDEAEQAWRLRTVHDAIDRLADPRDRRIMRSFEREERVADIARELGVNESRVSQLRARAIRNVRRDLANATPSRVAPPRSSVPVEARLIADAAKQNYLASVYANDDVRRRRKSVIDGRKGGDVWKQTRRPKGGFTAARERERLRMAKAVLTTRTAG